MAVERWLTWCNRVSGGRISCDSALLTVATAEEPHCMVLVVRLLFSDVQSRSGPSMLRVRQVLGRDVAYMSYRLWAFVDFEVVLI
jgi:hypothetical protein